MRYTPLLGPRMACRDISTVIVNPFLQKKMTSVITGVAGRLGTNAVMGAFLYKKGTVSASKVSGGAKFILGGKTHDEWCHLIGDALGGPTTGENLVAGSYGANTYMACLEKLLKGRTEIELKVVAHCNTAHVAEYIEFTPKLRSNTAKKIKFTIDAKNYYFTEQDAKDQQKILSDWMKSVGLKTG
ncbi:hypothetical protein [Azospirillum doebereinerae]